MSTPKDPGQKLPDKPATPPSFSPVSAPGDSPTSRGGGPAAETRSVLERLKAAQPRVAAPVDDDGRDVRGTDRPTARQPAPRTEPRTEHPGVTTAEPPHKGPSSGGASSPEDSTAVQRMEDAERAQELKRAQEQKRARNTERAQEARERLRSAADRARNTATTARGAAWVTGRALGRGSSAAVRHVGSWNEDVVRQVVVTLCTAACIAGLAAGVGAFGGPSIRDAAGGLLAPDATLLAPASSAFSIWGVIYAGLIAYAAFQWLPGQRRSARQRRLGWIVAASMLLNLAWILGAQSGGLTLSLVIIMALLLTLLAAVTTLNDHPAQTRPEGLLVDTPIGLYLGWVLVAAAANGAAFLTAREVDLFGLGGNTWAIIGIVGVLMTAAVVCSTDRGRLSVAAATSWGLLWIGVERALGQPVALDVTFAAALSIFLLLITAGSRRHRVDHAHRRRLRAEEDAKREPFDILDDDYEDSRY